MIFGFCNPLLDITASVDKHILEKYSLKPNDAILATDAHKELPVELKSTYTVEYSAGGAGQNTMRAAQWILPAKSTAYAGCIGNDEFGNLLREKAESDGLITKYMLSDTPTGTCCVLLSDQNRSLVADLQAANKYKVSHCQSLLSEPEFIQAQIIYVTGFFITVSLDSIRLLQENKGSKLFAMNLSAPFICQFFYDPLISLLPKVDLLFGNESEALEFARSTKWETVDIAEIAMFLSTFQGSRTVVITQGTDDTLVVVNGSLTRFPVSKVDNVIDTNGAGDAFVGGYLSQLLQGKSIKEAVNAGHYIARTIVQTSGISFSGSPQTDFQ